MIYEEHTFAAASQILSDSFFQNPAELSLVHKLQLVAGDVYLKPSFKFSGTSYGNTGHVKSKVNDSLPYLLTAYRLSKNFVFGVNITPSSYGHLNWPTESIVALSTTTTKVIYYRVAAQSSYQLTSNLALGVGINLEYNKQFELDYIVNGMGNQINQISGKNPSADIGLLYKINTKNYLTTAVYTPVNTMGRGTSSLNNLISNNFAMTISQAPVAFVGLQHLLNDRWFFQEKIYWSGWSMQKNIIMSNTTTGSVITPTNWKDVWSFQISTRYATTERLALLGFANYETNPINARYNQIGYPLAPFGALGAGIDLNIKSGLSTQIVVGYGGFIPSAVINNSNSTGVVSFYVPSATMQLTYKT